VQIATVCIRIVHLQSPYLFDTKVATLSEVDTTSCNWILTGGHMAGNPDGKYIQLTKEDSTPIEDLRRAHPEIRELFTRIDKTFLKAKITPANFCRSTETTEFFSISLSTPAVKKTIFAQKSSKTLSA
jgi:hypothetical protein